MIEQSFPQEIGVYWQLFLPLVMLSVSGLCCYSLPSSSMRVESVFLPVVLLLSWRCNVTANVLIRLDEPKGEKKKWKSGTHMVSVLL